MSSKPDPLASWLFFSGPFWIKCVAIHKAGNPKPLADYIRQTALSGLQILPPDVMEHLAQCVESARMKATVGRPASTVADPDLERRRVTRDAFIAGHYREALERAKAAKANRHRDGQRGIASPSERAYIDVAEMYSAAEKQVISVKAIKGAVARHHKRGITASRK